MKIGALFVAAAAASGPCPSTNCWDHDTALNKCTLKSACVEVTCSHYAMIVGYKLGVFGTAEDSTSAGGSPPASAGGMYQKTIDLADATLDFTDATKLKFKTRVELGGGDSNRARTDTEDKEISLDLAAGLKIITTPFGVGVDFTCSYDSAFAVSSNDFTVQDISITGSHSSTGDLTDSMTMLAGTGGPGGDIVLGNEVNVATTWDLRLSSVSFHYKACTVTQGSKSVKLMTAGCRSSTLNVEHVPNSDSSKIEMKYKSFMIDGMSGTEQTVSCDIQICAGTSSCIRDGTSPACNSYTPAAYEYIL